MNKYTDMMDSRYGDLDAGSDTFEEDLLKFAATFRPFSEGLNTFLLEQGYTGDINDIESKTAFIKDHFRAAGMQPPREVALWFSQNQPIVRDTAFQLCFAFDLDLKQTEEFFKHVFARERCFDCHAPAEAVYYWCIKNHHGWGEAQNVLSAVPSVRQGTIECKEVLYTTTIRKELDQLRTIDELRSYMIEKQENFTYNNAAATEAIQRLWHGIVGAGGLLSQEYERFHLSNKGISSGKEVKVWDAYLAIMGVEKDVVRELPGDRTLKAVVEQLPKAISDSFPGRQSIEKLLHGHHVDYEVVRKLLILLCFYDFWCREALNNGSYQAGRLCDDRFRAFIDDHLTDVGYMGLYPGNPYDWVALYAAQENEPLPAFRQIWNSLTHKYLADASENPKG